MARSSEAECARLGLLSEIEVFVLSRYSYGFALARIDQEIAARSDGPGVSAEQTMIALCDVLGITDVRVPERFRKAGKLYIDAKEIEREQGLQITTPGAYGYFGTSDAVPAT
jgi:hypothetical protein